MLKMKITTSQKTIHRFLVPAVICVASSILLQHIKKQPLIGAFLVVLYLIFLFAMIVLLIIDTKKGMHMP